MSGRLRLESRFADPDEVFEDLLVAHAELDARQSGLMNAKLVLILANHIGNAEVVRQAIAAASDSMPAAAVRRRRRTEH